MSPAGKSRKSTRKRTASKNETLIINQRCSPDTNSNDNSQNESSFELTSNYESDYAIKRQRNNAAVNKTRQKKRQEEKNTHARVQELREENEKLERRLESMRRELELLKEMVVACASGRRNCASATTTNPIEKNTN